jgi:hypothetical protein
MRMWVSCIASNKDSAEYGQKIAESANMYSSPEFGADTYIGVRIPHGEEVEVLEIIRDNEACRVRYKGTEGYVQFVMLADYDPSEGLRPNPFH